MSQAEPHEDLDLEDLIDEGAVTVGGRADAADRERAAARGLGGGGGRLRADGQPEGQQCRRNRAAPH